VCHHNVHTCFCVVVCVSLFECVCVCVRARLRDFSISSFLCAFRVATHKFLPHFFLWMKCVRLLTSDNRYEKDTHNAQHGYLLPDRSLLFITKTEAQTTVSPFWITIYKFQGLATSTKTVLVLTCTRHCFVVLAVATTVSAATDFVLDAILRLSRFNVFFGRCAGALTNQT
jgi:hypothetical protein